MDNEKKLLDYLKRVVGDLREANARIKTLEERDAEPVAIVSMACRYPGGVRSPEELWALVSEGRDATGDFPSDRGWDVDGLYDPDPAAQGKSYTRRGGFLYDAADFDPEPFGISPREATAMDPQQRLLLETSWEVFERAGLDPKALAGTDTGVFVGSGYQDYATRIFAAAGDSDGYLGTGNSASVISGRLAYTFGLQGPAVTVDTACSSSLVALHLAVQALRNGECSMALAAGVMVMSSPTAFVEFSRQRGLAADGRCKSFSDGADGTGWGEGIGVLLVEKLSDARRLGHDVLAVVRGSAVNQDGASNGLTAPNGPAQRRVIDAALLDAGLSTSEVDAVEAHGTGTVLGDPIEAGALLATYGRDRSERDPLWLGSLKSNIGHTQAAAGVGGIIKMVMAMRHDVLPKTLHADTPTSKVDWSSGDVRLLDAQVAWPRTDRPRRAGISSFGVSGTNAHVIIEEATTVPVEPAQIERTLPALPWIISARSDAAVRDAATRLLEVDASAIDVAYSLATTRAHLDHRAAVTGTSIAELHAGLNTIADGTSPITAVNTGPLAFAFSGQGSQTPDMGRELYETYPVFKAAYDEIQALLGLELHSLDADALNQTGNTQPALFALQVSLARLLQSYGVTPDVLIGHSIGEIAAAHIAGILSLQDAAALVSARASLMQALPTGGAMTAIAATEDEITPHLTDTASIAAINAPQSLVVSGAEADVDNIAAHFTDQGRKTTSLKVSHAFHSPLMTPMLDAFRTVAQDLTFNQPSITLITSGDPTTADYWIDHILATVRYADNIASLTERNVSTLVEIGPSTTLTALTNLNTDQITAIPTQLTPRERVITTDGNYARTGGAAAFTTALAHIHTTGHHIDWTTYYHGTGAQRTTLPTYAFQRQRLWLDVPGTESSAVSSLAYGEVWVPLDLASETADASGWLVVSELSTASNAAALATRIGADVLQLDTEGRGSLATRLAEISVPSTVVAVLADVTQLLVLVQALGDAGIEAPLWAITSGAVATGHEDRVHEDRVHEDRGVTAPDHAMIWGAGRVAALEHSARWGGVIDVPAEVDDTVADRIVDVVADSRPDDQLAVRHSGIYSRRLTHIDLPTPHEAWTPRGTILITGGTGALGAHVARWAASEGAEHIVLTSRRGRNAAGADDLVASLEQLGSRVTVAACDVSDRSALTELVETLGDSVTAVVHAAGVADGGMIIDTDTAEFVSATAAKALGARHLHEVLGDRKLDAFVVFSSIAGVWGGGGQSAYSAANAYLDALSHHRRSLGLVSTAIAWGPWAGGGMVADGEDEDRLRRRGLRPLAPSTALDAMRRAVGSGLPTTTVVDIDWPAFAAPFTAVRPSPLLSELPELRTESDDAAVGDSRLVAELASLDPSERLRKLLELVRGHAARVLGHSGPASIPAGSPFQELGVDSLTAVELRNSLGTDLGRTLPSTLVFDHPTPAAVAEYLTADIGREETSQQGRRVSALSSSEDPIAIVSMSCKYPGGVSSPEDLWDLVVSGGDAISGFPDNRGWDLDGLYDPDPDREGTSYTRSGGFLHDAGEFDAAFFGISPREALAMDPQQRLLLESTWELFERAGLDPADLRGSRTGVYVGSGYQDYTARALDVPDGVEGYLSTGNSASVISGRLSYVFGLRGPSLTVDTACSSSLVAIHLAAQALRRGECERAVVGGVMVMSSPGAFVQSSRQRALSADGRCKAFAASADGTGFGEGVGLVLLERLSDAVAGGHEVLGIVAGSSVNSDGASNGLTAPSGPAQQDAIRSALDDAGLSTADVDAVEAHGTGTGLGDPIEAHALLATYGLDRASEHPVWLGSLKSNIGHTQAAAGVGGVIKMVMAMRHGILPRTLHADEPSPRIEWDSGDVELLTENTTWPETGRARRAAISSFGVSGTNSHVVLEAPSALPTPVDRDRPDTDVVVPLSISARSSRALGAQCAALADLFEESDPAPVAVAHALATRRSALEHRAVVLAGDGIDVVAALRAVGAGKTIEDTVVGRTDAEGRTVFVFPGQGSQWPAMAAELLETSTVFAATARECAAELEKFVDWDVVAVLRGEEDSADLGRLDVVQPVLFTVMVSIAALWRSIGVVPDAVVGHSQGEVAAAYVAGALTLHDAARIMALRSKSWLDLVGHGAMLAVASPAEDTKTRLKRWDGRLSIAGINGPSAVTVSGDPDAITELEAELTELGVRCKRIRGANAAGHSVQVEALRPQLLDALAPISPSSASIPFYSTVTGSVFDTAGLGAEYWYRNMRETVLFEPTMRALAADGYGVFVESSPHPVLTGAIEDIVPSAVVAGSLRREHGGYRRFLTSAAELWVRGGIRSLITAIPTGPHDHVDLPTYRFDRKHYWLRDAAPALAAADPAEESFWAAIGRGDTDEVRATLRLADGAELPDVLHALDAWRSERVERVAVDALNYRVEWQPLARHAPASPVAGTWLVLRPGWGTPADAAHVDSLEVQLRGSGVAIASVAVPIDADRASLAALLPSDRPTAVLSLLGLAGGQHPEYPEVTASLACTFAAVQALADRDIEAPIWCVTSGAVSTEPSDTLSDPVQAQLWGLGRVVALERPRSWGGLVDLPARTDDAEANQSELLTAIVSGIGEDQLAVRDGVVLGARLRRWTPESATASEWTPSGTVLVTGGTGGIGRHVARWLAAAGVDHLVLTSRSGRTAPGVDGLVEELQAEGARVTVHACDVSDYDAVAALVKDLGADDRITSVFHTAGIASSSMVVDADLDELAAMSAAKVRGADNLDQLLGDELDAFVLFSSGAAVWGSGGQGSYAAANAYLDALAHQRRARGAAATSIAWGGWSDGGMVDATVESRFALRGLSLMPPERALRALGSAIGSAVPSAVVADIGWDRFVPTFTLGRPSPLLGDIPEAVAATETEDSADTAEAASVMARRLAGLSAPDQLAALRDFVSSEAASVLGYDEPIDLTTPFLELGFDSLTAIDLRNRLSAATGSTLPTAVVFDHPTAEGLASHLASLTGVEVDATPDSAAEDSIVALYRNATRTGQVTEAMAMLADASRFAVSFDAADATAAEPVRFASAAADSAATLVCFAPYIAPAGIHQYARFAGFLADDFDVLGLPAPGFGVGDPLPVDIDALVAAHRATIRAAGDGPVVLLGYSSGGWIAHAVAEKLTAEGTAPAAVVMVDSFSRIQAMDPKFLSAMGHQQAEKFEDMAGAGAQLMAMGGYLRMFDAWTSAEIPAPTLLVRALENMPNIETSSAATDSRPAPPEHVDTVVEVPGNHYTMMEDHAETTARAVSSWLAERELTTRSSTLVNG